MTSQEYTFEEESVHDSYNESYNEEVIIKHDKSEFSAYSSIIDVDWIISPWKV